jgi:hypothetical protein
MGIFAVKSLRWLLLAAIVAAWPAQAFWQSRDSNYNASIAAGAAYVGPGDIASAYMWWGVRAYNTAYANAGGKAINLCTPADAACADISVTSAGVLNAAQITSLGTCNNSTNLCLVKTFYDQSGSTHCYSAACDETQSTFANQAILVVPGASNGCPNASDYCVKRTASTQYYTAVNNTLSPPTSPFTYSAVAVRTGATYNSTVILYAGANEFNFYTSGLIQIFAGTVANASQTEGTWHAFQGVFGTAGGISVDGAITSLNSGSNNMGGSAIQLLDNGSPDIYYIEEAGVWSGASSTTVQGNMCHNQYVFWGLPNAC